MTARACTAVQSPLSAFGANGELTPARRGMPLRYGNLSFEELRHQHQQAGAKPAKTASAEGPASPPVRNATSWLDSGGPPPTADELAKLASAMVDERGRV